jgi:hypothetical protein
MNGIFVASHADVVVKVKISLLQAVEALDKRLTHGSKVVSPTRPPHFTLRFLFLRFLVFTSVRG